VANADPSLVVGGFESRHPSIVVFLFTDGAVHWLQVGISLAVLQQLGHRCDGQLLDDSRF
jgi:hypothetical protein